MPVFKLRCSFCDKEFERKRLRQSKHNYCSRECQGRHSSELYSDEYSTFRHMYLRAKHDSNKKYREFNISLDDIKNIWEKQKGICNLSGVEVKFGETNASKQHGGSTASLDRIDSTIGYLPDNIQIVHKEINDLKSNLSEDVFINWCRLVAEHTKNREIRLDSFADPYYNKSVLDENEIPF